MFHMKCDVNESEDQFMIMIHMEFKSLLIDIDVVILFYLLQFILECFLTMHDAIEISC